MDLPESVGTRWQNFSRSRKKERNSDFALGSKE
jgi:hypothetical protein